MGIVAVIAVVLFLGLVFEIAFQLDTNGSRKPKESPVLDCKARFTQYVEGERRLMAEWEEAFDPAGAARERWNKTHMYGHWQNKRAGREVYVPGGMPPAPAPMDPYMMPSMDADEYFQRWYTPELDRDQCKLEADHMLGMALITAQEYGPRIKRCNQEMQA